MNPRLSIQGRMSIDGWNGAGGTPMGGGHHSRLSDSINDRSPFSGHSRRGSSGFRGPQTIFNALEDEDDGLGGDSVGLERLAEVEETFHDDDFDGVDERTHLRSMGRDGSRNGSGSRSPRSPGSPHASQGDGKRVSPH